MSSMNKVFLAGNLTRKPVLRRTPKGTAVTDLLLALNREYVTAGGKKQKEVCFVDVVVWGKLAEECISRLDCSSSVVVVGHLQLDVWYSKDGEKRCKLRVYAEEVYFLDITSDRSFVDRKGDSFIETDELEGLCMGRSYSSDEMAYI